VAMAGFFVQAFVTGKARAHARSLPDIVCAILHARCV
jgi:hypothetical protein